MALPPYVTCVLRRGVAPDLDVDADGAPRIILAVLRQGVTVLPTVEAALTPLRPAAPSADLKPAVLGSGGVGTDPPWTPTPAACADAAMPIGWPIPRGAAWPCLLSRHREPLPAASAPLTRAAVYCLQVPAAPPGSLGDRAGIPAHLVSTDCHIAPWHIAALARRTCPLPVLATEGREEGYPRSLQLHPEFVQQAWQVTQPACGRMVCEECADAGRTVHAENHKGAVAAYPVELALPGSWLPPCVVMLACSDPFVVP